MIAPIQGRVAGPVGADPVVTVDWPAHDDLRRLVAATGRAALLVVAADQPPPTDLGPLEDWLRRPIDPLELDSRGSELRLRHRLRQHGTHLDDDGVLHRAGQRVALSDGQQVLIAPLLAGIDRPVAQDAVRDAVERSGRPAHADQLRRALHRLRARVATVGLDLCVLSGRAVVLQPADDDSSHGAHPTGNTRETSTQDPDARPTRLV